MAGKGLVRILEIEVLEKEFRVCEDGPVMRWERYRESGDLVYAYKRAESRHRDALYGAPGNGRERAVGIIHPFKLLHAFEGTGEDIAYAAAEFLERVITICGRS